MGLFLTLQWNVVSLTNFEIKCVAQGTTSRNNLNPKQGNRSFKHKIINNLIVGDKMLKTLSPTIKLYDRPTHKERKNMTI